MSSVRKNTWALVLAFLLLLAVCTIQAVFSGEVKSVHAGTIVKQYMSELTLPPATDPLPG